MSANDDTPTLEEVREYVTRLRGNDSSLVRAQAEAVGLWFDKFVLAERIRIAKKATEKALASLIGYEDIRKLTYHHPTDKSVGGILGVCSCGQPIDDFIKHIKEVK